MRPVESLSCASRSKLSKSKEFKGQINVRGQVGSRGRPSKWPSLISSLMFAFVLLSFVLFLGTNALALDLDKAKEFYLQMLSNAHSYAKEVAYEIKYDLPLYRFWKIFAVGSVEWAESTKKTGDYLSYLKSVHSETEGFKDELELARTIYLSYLEAKLSLKTFSTSLVKNSTLFNDFFRDYQFRLSEAFGSYAQDLIAYLLGANVDLPYVPDKLKNLRTQVENFQDYTPQYNGQEAHAISILVDNPELQETISEAIAEAKKSFEQAETPDKDLIVARARGMILRSAMSQIAGLKDVIADEFVRVTPKQRDPLPLRWIAYLALFAAWYLVFKNLNIPLMIFVASETVYLATLSNVLSTADGMIYGISAGVAILFSVAYFLRRREWPWFILATASLVLLFVPSFSTQDLLMNENFTKSPFFEALKNDLLYDAQGTLQRTLKNYNTVLNESVQSYTDLVYEVLPEGELETALSEEYVELTAMEKRLAFAKGLKVPDPNTERLVKDFVFFEEGRIRKAKAELSKMKSVFSKMLVFSSRNFREELRSFIEKNFEGQARRELLDLLETTRQATAIKLAGYQVRTVLYSFVMIFFALFLRILKRPEWLILTLGAFASSILSFVGPQEVFVQYGVPTLVLRGTMFNPAALAISLILGVAWLRENTTLRRRERV